jgi:hypothetical protein
VGDDCNGETIKLKVLKLVSRTYVRFLAWEELMALGESSKKRLEIFTREEQYCPTRKFSVDPKVYYIYVWWD